MRLTEQHLSVLFNIKTKVLDKETECSGAIFKDGSFSFSCGDKHTARVDDSSDFIWHSHPSGNLMMSVDDWLCFFISKATCSALFADNTILVVKKTDFHKKLHEKLYQTAVEFKGFHSILYRNFISILDDYFDVEIENLKKDEISPDLFRVEYQVIDNK